MSATTQIYHDKRRAKNCNAYPLGHPLCIPAAKSTNSNPEPLKIYPVKLRVTFHRKHSYYPFSTKCDLTESDFANVFKPNAKGKYKDIQDALIAERKAADDVIASFGKKFSMALFKGRFAQPAGGQLDLFNLLAALEAKLLKAGQNGTAVMTGCTLKSIKKFHPKPVLKLEDVDKAFLIKYEKWMEDQGRTAATIGMYLRRMRVVFMEAVEAGTLPAELYPFKGFEIPVGKNVKKALSHYEVGLIARYKPESDSQAKARDMWLLTFYGNGINMKDIALLKHKNIHGNMMRFERAKTKRSNKSNPIIISFAITPPVAAIIKKWGNRSNNPDSYIFPILPAKPTPDELYHLVQYAVKTTNKHMKSICKSLGIKGKATTYVARHSFSTTLKNLGRNVEFISEALGHQSIKTTQAYLANFEDEAKHEAAELLFNFPTQKSN